MKILLAILILSVSMTAQKRLSIFTGFGRSAPVTEKKIERKQFNVSLAFVIRLNKRANFNITFVESFKFKTPSLRIGISYRIF